MFDILRSDSVHFYRLFASTPIDLSFLRVQQASANSAPFLMTSGPGLADDIKSVLAGIKAEWAEYPSSLRGRERQSWNGLQTVPTSRIYIQ